MEKPPTATEVQGTPLSSLDRFWLETARSTARESLHAIEEAAKQIISLTTLLQAIYFAAIALGEVKVKLMALSGNTHWLLILLMVVPLICWMASLWLSILVFLPEIYRTQLNSPELSRAFFLDIVRYKHRRLNQAYIALASGFAPMLVAIIVYLTV